MTGSTDLHGNRWLDLLERLGNRLPEPVTLFAMALLLVMLLSQLGAWLGWSALTPEAERIEVRSLLDGDGIWWLLSHMVQNFVQFPPLGIVLVAMFGIGIAERSGLLAALLEKSLRSAPQRLLTPAVIFLGITSSLTVDAGYVVLPPLAAALYYAAGRSPLVGLAAAFAGVSAGYSANLFITALDPLLAGLTQSAAQIIAPDYRVAVTANWFFAATSVFLLTLIGWWVTARFVEPRQQREAIAAPDDATVDSDAGRRPQAGLRAAGLTLVGLMTGVLLLILIPGAPLHGDGEQFARWIEAMVPLLFLIFLACGLAYGITAGTICNDRDVAGMLGDTVRGLAPYIVLAFAAAQFIEAFRYSQLGLLLAIAGGEALASLAAPAPLMVTSFIALVVLANLVMGSASAKYALLAPVFVPMLMQAGLSPELTQAAYRVGDSVSNVITPLNPYWVIILAFAQRWQQSAGIGTLLALMLPYAISFAIFWSLLLAIWVLIGLPLGPGGGTTYP